MSKIYEQNKFIEYLRETPLVSFACKKTGIARATYYRWHKDNKYFRDQVELVLHQGRKNINDLAEATLIKMIKGENFNATRFWLQHNSKRYVPVRTIYVPPPKHDHFDLKPGETCIYCGSKNNKVPPSFGGGGIYEREDEENKKLPEAEMKKKKKMSGKEKKEKINEIIKRREVAESFERFGEFDPHSKALAKGIRDGTAELPPEIGRPPEYIKKADRVENVKLDLDLE